MSYKIEDIKIIRINGSLLFMETKTETKFGFIVPKQFVHSSNTELHFITFLLIRCNIVIGEGVLDYNGDRDLKSFRLDSIIPQYWWATKGLIIRHSLVLLPEMFMENDILKISHNSKNYIHEIVKGVS